VARRGQAEKHAIKRVEALELRIAGGSYRKIGEQLGVSGKTAYQWVTQALADVARLQAEQAEQLKALELERLDRLTVAIGRPAMTGDPRAVRAAVAVIQERAKLLGLYAPSEVRVRAGDELAALLNAARERAPIPPAQG
jgi:hypothetical protein